MIPRVRSGVIGAGLGAPGSGVDPPPSLSPRSGTRRSSAPTPCQVTCFHHSSGTRPDFAAEIPAGAPTTVIPIWFSADHAIVDSEARLLTTFVNGKKPKTWGSTLCAANTAHGHSRARTWDAWEEKDQEGARWMTGG
ncbi:hypothetical protein VTJ04DRAFT_10222 [Mycothermus thermophilus]|uniref:uncharacterized protein n=1 Tax=Humicola insolens TaxID=85995 RepID=UPI003743C924